MKYTDRAKLGPNTDSRQLTAKQFDDKSEAEQKNLKENLHCRYCNERMSFIARIPGKSRAYFRHQPGVKGEECKKIKYISPDAERSYDSIKTLIQSKKTFGVKNHKYKAKGKIDGPNGSSGGGAGEPTEPGDKPRPRNKKKIILHDKADLSIQEIIEQVLNGNDLSKKELLFYGKVRPFNDVVINVHKITQDIKDRLSDGMPRIFWGDFFKICCEKNGSDCSICDLKDIEISNLKIKVFCGQWEKNEPRILFDAPCGSSMLKTYGPLKRENPHGCLAVVSEHTDTINHTHPVIFVHNFRNNVFYLD